MFKIEFETDNAAFDDYWGEVIRIIEDVAFKIRLEGEIPSPTNIRDSNGNTIGELTYTTPTPEE